MSGFLVPRTLVRAGAAVLCFGAIAIGAAQGGDRAEGARASALVLPPVEHVEASAPWLYALPPAAVMHRPAVLTVEVVHGGRVAIRQTTDLPSVLPAEPVIELLVDQRRRLERLRGRAGEGSLEIRIRLDGQLFDTLSPAEMEERTRGLAGAGGTPVGTVRRIEVFAAEGPRRAAAAAYEDGRDPQCVQQCDDERYFCYTEICDPRGSCEFCEDAYDSCVLSCPICPTTRQFSTTTVTSQSYLNSSACFQGLTTPNGRRYQLSSRTLRTRYWREDRSCAGTVTTTLLNTVNWSETCWQQQGISCSPIEPNFTPYGKCVPY